MRPIASLAIAFGLAAASILSTAADVVFLKDGGRLRCEVISPDEAADPNNEFIQIRVNRTTVWLKRDAIDKIEETADDPQPTATDRELIERLKEIGYILEQDDSQPAIESADAEERSEVRLLVKRTQGWAYLSDTRLAETATRREPLNEGMEVPVERMVMVSGNSRATLEIEGMGAIGLYPGTQIRFDELFWDPSVQNYRINLRLEHGGAWFDIGENEKNWRRVIININTVQTIVQTGVLLAEAGSSSGAVNVSYLEGAGEIRFWRSRDPYLLSPGQALSVSPQFNKLAIQEPAGLDEKLQTIRNWSGWTPEPLALNFDRALPPLQTFPPFPALPALHPYEIPIDLSVVFPPITMSMGELLEAYNTAIERYKFDTGRYPPEELGLDALERPHDIAGWKGPYLPLEFPRKDMWGSPFVYDFFKDGNNEYVSVRSIGPNRHDDKGLGDDIR